MSGPRTNAPPNIIRDIHEEWRDVPNFEGKYKISNYGRVERFYQNGKRKMLTVGSYFEPLEDQLLVIPLILEKVFSKGVIMYCKNEENFDLDGEVWKSVMNFPKYEISNKGRVKQVSHMQNHPTGKMSEKYIPEIIMKNGISNCGYVRVRLNNKEIVKHWSIHRLVATAFIPNPHNLPQVNHIDGNKTNNCVENLEWCNASENKLHAIRTGLTIPQRGEQRTNSILTDELVREIRKIRQNEGLSQDKIAARFGLKRGPIKAVLEGRTWKHVI